MLEVEIERLVQWAYRDELPKRGIGDVANSWKPMSDYRDLLTVVDDDPGFPVIMGMTHPDALTIERAVQGLQTEVALDWHACRGLLMGDLPHLAPRGNPLLDRASHDGKSLEPRIFSEVALVESCARMGTRPQWDIGIPSPQRVIGKNNRPVLVGGSEGNGRYTYGSYCPLKYTAPTIEQLILRRFEYMVWRGGLDSLAGILRGWLLRAHVALKPTAPVAPWLDVRPSTSPAIPGPSSWRTWVDEPTPKGPSKRGNRNTVPEQA